MNVMISLYRYNVWRRRCQWECYKWYDDRRPGWRRRRDPDVWISMWW